MELFALWWPVALVVGADVIYQVCAKKLSSHASPMAALGVTYIASAIVCAVLFEIMVPGKSIFAELLSSSLRLSSQALPLQALKSDPFTCTGQAGR